jgi:hypothetical protein
MEDTQLIMLGLRTPKHKFNRRRFLFYPNDTWKVMGWDLLVSLILLITCVQTPVDMAFATELDKNPKYVLFRNIVDLIFFIDILINFNTAIADELFEMNDNRCDIALSYGKGWFIIDFMAILPFELII